MKNILIGFGCAFGFAFWAMYVDENPHYKPLNDNEASKLRSQDLMYINACRTQGKQTTIRYTDNKTLETDYRCVHKQIHTVANGCKHGN